MWEQVPSLKRETKELNFYKSLAKIKEFFETHNIPWNRDISEGLKGWHRMKINNVIVDFPYKGQKIYK